MPDHNITPTARTVEPFPQTLAASALAWIMSTALEEADRGRGVSGSGGGVGSIKGVGVDIGPLLGLVLAGGQVKLGDGNGGVNGEGGDAASDAARAVLTGLAVKRPLLVVPEVRPALVAFMAIVVAVVTVAVAFAVVAAVVVGESTAVAVAGGRRVHEVVFSGGDGRGVIAAVREAMDHTYDLL